MSSFFAFWRLKGEGRGGVGKRGEGGDGKGEKRRKERKGKMRREMGGERRLGEVASLTVISKSRRLYSRLHDYVPIAFSSRIHFT